MPSLHAHFLLVACAAVHAEKDETDSRLPKKFCRAWAPISAAPKAVFQNSSSGCNLLPGRLFVGSLALFGKNGDRRLIPGGGSRLCLRGALGGW